jgi:hypothetical protein
MVSITAAGIEEIFANGVWAEAEGIVINITTMQPNEIKLLIILFVFKIFIGYMLEAFNFIIRGEIWTT